MNIKKPKYLCKEQSILLLYVQRAKEQGGEITFVHLLSCSLPLLNLSPLVWDRIPTTPTVVFLLKSAKESPTYFFYIPGKNISNYKAQGLKGFT